MKAEVHCIQVGWGDAHFIRLPSGHLTLVDGGDLPENVPGGDTSAGWMDRCGEERLDCMILTHLHDDHLNGLLEVARRKRVLEAVLPYKPFVLPESILAGREREDQTGLVCRLLARYLELIALLQENGTRLIWRDGYGQKDQAAIWHREGYTFEQLYPRQDDPLPAWAALTEALLACRDEIGAAGAGWLERFHQLSNHDSSVYLLTRDEASGDGGVLFGGDLLEEGWKRLAQRLQLRCRVWKAPHHGVNDAFNAATLRLTRPEVAIIPICSERAQALQAQWTSLASEELGQGVQLRITGDVPPATSKLITDGDILVYIG
ncbi:ComEC/Rec2 family competence protein [Paenibacillus naphthalenovorans]|uniref:ComEC/Rec2 family competence protein n=1 Tax=Paenibacillus naphthalenovorans TaxID=162209 RepID=UPI003D2D93FC